MRRVFFFAIASAALICLPQLAQAQATNPFVGETLVTAFNYCPAGWLPLEGQVLSITQYNVLYQLLGTTYGGNGKTTFRLPKARPIYSAQGAALTQCISYQGVFPSQN